MLPQTTPEQRQEMYEGILDLLHYGFLATPVRLGDISLSLRTLSKGDLFLLQHRTAHSNTEDIRRWMIASSIWMANGHVLLSEPAAVPWFYEKLQGLRPPHTKLLVHVLNSLSKQQVGCYDMIDAFCAEPLSRAMWRQTNGTFPSSAYSGVPGVEHLGMNIVQKLWVAHNRTEDLREKIDSEWAHAKFVASATAPKGVEQLNQKESTMREAERTRKQELFDKTYYRWLGYLRSDGTTPGSDLPVFRQASTPDELAEEMRKWVSGEMDAHDQIVADYKRRILENYERDMEARRQSIEAARQQAEEAGEDPTTLKLVGYTLDQLRDRIQPALHKTVYEAPKGAEYLYNRYLSHVPEKGKLAVQDGKVVVVEPPPLDEQIAGRQVRYDSKR